MNAAYVMNCCINQSNLLLVCIPFAGVASLIGSKSSKIAHIAEKR